MKNIREWLASIFLEEYTERFIENGIDDVSVVSDLTEQDLINLGVLVGHRRRMLRLIAQYSSASLTKPQPEAGLAPHDDAERRQLTILFYDLVGSSTLSARMDPEDMRHVITTFHTCISEIVVKYQGVVTRYMGDGALVYFGYPRAHEDDAEQALLAALALIEVLPKLKTSIDVALQVRVGIATGTIVMGDLLIGEGPVERTIVGDTPNLAERLQKLAEPGTVLICANTHRLTKGHFIFRNLGPLALKGWTEPVPAWQVLETSDAESRFEATHKTKLPPLIGREEETELISRRWRLAVHGEGRIVLLTGEPGIGKSHLALAFDEKLQTEPHVTLRYYCSAHHSNSVLFPVIRQLERAARFERSDAPEEKLAKLEALLALSTSDTEHVALLADLLSLPFDNRHSVADLSPLKRKEMTLEALLAQLDGLAAQQPVCMIFEDVHWIDPTSLELLSAMVKRAEPFLAGAHHGQASI